MKIYLVNYNGRVSSNAYKTIEQAREFINTMEELAVLSSWIPIVGCIEKKCKGYREFKFFVTFTI